MVIGLLPYIHTFLLAVVNYNFYTKKMHIFALTSVAQLVGYHPSKQKVVGLIPGQGTRLGCGFLPRRDAYETDPHFSLTPMFLCVCFSLPSPLSKNK